MPSTSVPVRVTVIEAASSAPLPTAPPTATGASLTDVMLTVVVATDTLAFCPSLIV